MSSMSATPTDGGFICKRPTRCRIHPSFDIAGEEAVRLSAQYPDSPFLILKVVGRVVPEQASSSPHCGEGHPILAADQPAVTPCPHGGALVEFSEPMLREDLKPDIEVTKRAIERVAGSLTGDKAEFAAIVLSAAFGAVSEVLTPLATASLLRSIFAEPVEA